MTIPPPPDLGPEYEQTIDELDAISEECSGRDYMRVIIKWSRRRAARDAILDLQDELNAAGLVIVPEAEWNAGQEAIERNAYLQALVDLGDDEG